MIVEPAVLLHGHEVVAVPLVFGLESHTRAEKIERSRTVEGNDSHTMLDGFNLHSPIPSMSAGMKVAIVHKRLDRDTKGTAGSEQRVSNVSGVLSLAHPNALFEQGVGEHESPNRRRALQTETFDIQITLGINGATRPAICCERVLGAVIAGHLVQFRDHLRSSNRGLERRDQKAMIAARQIAADRSRGVSPDAVGDKPFPLFGNLEGVANLSAEFNIGLARVRGHFRFRQRTRASLRHRHVASFHCRRI